jgi:uncharacterized protein YuzE
MRVTYSPDVDAAYIYLREVEAGGVVYTYSATPEIETDMINLDFDREGRLVGIEVLSASRHLPPELIGQARAPGQGS